MVDGSNGISWSYDWSVSFFLSFNKGKSKYGEERYFKITKDLYEDLI